MQLPIYLDNAATTAVAPEVMEAMLPYFTQAYGNPATLYSVGMMARMAVDSAREIVAETLNASPDEIVFTSGGTEADNAAIKGIAQAHRTRRRHLITTALEHHAVLDPMESLAKQGFELDVVPVGTDGVIDFDELMERIRPDTLLVSVMHANNEIGTIQPISEIGAICRKRGIFFHTDAVQTFGKLPIDVKAMNIDLLSVSAHKFRGPKGAGFLYIRDGVTLTRYQEGGKQENGRRAGTLNTPGIVGLGKATEIARANMAQEAERLTDLRDRFLARLEGNLSGIRLNGSRTERLPNNLNFSIEGIAGESVLLELDAAGICAAAGSACSTGSKETSHVLRSLGVSRDMARSALRITLGYDTTEEALDYTFETLRRVVGDLRGLTATPALAR